MTAEQKAKRNLSVAALIIGLVVVVGSAYKFVLEPWMSSEEIAATSSDSQYKAKEKFDADLFMGYAPLRSETFANFLKKKGIRVAVRNDDADYVKRIKALKSGDTDLAVFTIDALLQAGAEIGEFPGTIVMVFDESSGADGVVTWKGTVPDMYAMNRTDARFVGIPNSPSEFLGRAILTQFSLANLPEKGWLLEKDKPEDVFNEFKSSKGSGNAYIMWEPFLSKALALPGAVKIVGSESFKGYIVDVLVANRKFLQEHEDLVQVAVESYFRTTFSYASQPGGMAKLVKEDDDSLTEDEAKNAATGIQWKNTLENYAYFGIRPNKDIDRLEDVIDKIAKVLVRTGALDRNPVEGKATTLYYSGVLAKMEAEDFHPGRVSNVVEGLGPTEQNLSAVRGVARLPPLADAQWAQLKPVGDARIAPLSFTRGSARLTVGSEHDVDDLAVRLRSMPTYYLKIVGHARTEGDAKANARLALERAESARDRLVSSGINADRLRAESAVPSGNGGAAQSVSFILGNAPY